MKGGDEKVLITITDIDEQDFSENEMFSPSIVRESAMKNDDSEKQFNIVPRANSSISGAPSSDSSRKSPGRRMNIIRG